MQLGLTGPAPNRAQCRRVNPLPLILNPTRIVNIKYCYSQTLPAPSPILNLFENEGGSRASALELSHYPRFPLGFRAAQRICRV